MTISCRKKILHWIENCSARVFPLVLGTLLLSAGSVIADELLEAGRWKGEYEPADLGVAIEADFCVKRAESVTPPWAVTMHLDLDPPGNRPVKFEQIAITENTLFFRLYILDAQSACRLQPKNGGQLVGVCKYSQDDPQKEVTLTMKRDSSADNADCPP